MESLAQALLIWIASNSQYSVDEIPLPTISLLTPQEIIADYYGNRTELIPETGVDDRVLALYDATSGDHGAIYLRIDEETHPFNRVSTITNSIANLELTAKSSLKSELDFLQDNPILTERLLHELVHHVQFQSGETENFLCPAYGEKEAYQLGGLYFRKRYIEDPMPNRNFWMRVYSRC